MLGRIVTRGLVPLLIIVAPCLRASADPPVSLDKLPTVTDSLNRVLGSTVDGGSVLRRIGTSIAVFGVEPDNAYTGIIFAHTTADCSGQRYIRGNESLFLPLQLGRDPLTNQPEAFLGSGSVIQLALETQESVSPDCIDEGGTPLANGYCCHPQALTDTVRLAVPVTLPEFVPPLTAK
jgi:hypothetical protein